MVRVRRGASKTLASVQPTKAERERRSARAARGGVTRTIPRPVFVSAAFGGAGRRGGGRRTPTRAGFRLRAGRSVVRASVRRQRVFPRKTTGARGRRPVRTGGGRLIGIGTTIGTRRRPTRLKSVRKAPTIRVLGVRKVRKKSVRRRPRLEVRKRTGARGRRPVRRRGGKLIRVSTKPFRRPRLVKVTSPSRGKARTIRVSSRSRLARKQRVRRPTRRPIRKTKPKKVRPARAITRVLGTRVIQRRRTRKPRKLRVVRGARGKVKKVKTRVIRVSTRPRGQRLRIVRGARGRVRRIGFTPPPRRSLRANPLTSLFAGQLPQGRRRIGSDFDVLSGF